MSKSQFGILVTLLVLLVATIGFVGYVIAMRNPEQGELQACLCPATGVKLCSVCGRDRVVAHGRILVKNTTRHHVTVYVRHHPDTLPKRLELDPNAFEIVEDVLVGTMMVRAEGEGFDPEEHHCQIDANRQHEMWWTPRGWEPHGTSPMHM